MPTSSKAKRFPVVFAVAASVGIVLLIVYLYYPKSAPPPQPQASGKPSNTQSEDSLDEEPSPGEDVSLGRMLGINNPAVPPVTMTVGAWPGEADAPDLSTPAAAVYSVLSLIDQDATDKLTGCFVDQETDMAGGLYRRYLGLPVELVDVVEDGESAVVIWYATVHTAFSFDGRRWSMGEKMPLTTRLSRVNGLWKLLKLYEGVKDGPQ